MKKMLCILLALLLLASFSTAAMAKGGGGNGGGKSSGSQHSTMNAKNDKQDHAAIKHARTASKAVHYWQVKGDVQFYDIENHWAANAIRHLAKYGLVEGFADGTFQPDAPMTQAETVALIMRWVEMRDAAESTDLEDPDEDLTEEVDELDEEADEDVDELNEEANDQALDANDAEDIDEEASDEMENEIPGWARHAIEGASTRGIININRFHSPVQASRAQVAVWIAKTMQLQFEDTSTMVFSDGILIAPEDIGYIVALQQSGYISGTSDGKFNPNASITRAEMATIMDRLLAEQLAEQQASAADPAEQGAAPDDTSSDPSGDSSGDSGVPAPADAGDDTAGTPDTTVE